MGGGNFVNFLRIYLRMETKSLKAYQAPRMDILDLELEQGVLNNMSGFSDTEKLDEEDFTW